MLSRRVDQLRHREINLPIGCDSTLEWAITDDDGIANSELRCQGCYRWGRIIFYCAAGFHADAGMMESIRVCLVCKNQIESAGA